jgi:hypothetical protein
MSSLRTQIKNTSSLAILFVVFITTLFVAQTAIAQIEQIGPFDLHGVLEDKAFGPYDNYIPPNPIWKEFTFTGVATNPHGTQPRRLRIYFDYWKDGHEFELHPLNEDNNIPGGAVQQAVAADLILNWCPDSVSIHFKTLDGSIVDISGYFEHTCYETAPPPTPTLSEWGMIIFCVLLFGWMAWVIVRRRKRVTAGI